MLLSSCVCLYKLLVGLVVAVAHAPTHPPALLRLLGVLHHSYGYDPLGLGKEPANLEKYRANELLHARWAMLAAAGIIIPEGLQANGADIKGGTWFETGAEMLEGGTLNYFAVPWGIVSNPLPLFVVIAIEVGLLGAVEFYRSNGTGPAGFSPGALRRQRRVWGLAGGGAHGQGVS